MLVVRPAFSIGVQLPVWSLLQSLDAAELAEPMKESHPLKERHAQHHRSGRPWLDTWMSFLLGFMYRLLLQLLPDQDDDSLHFLQETIADARGPLLCASWVTTIIMGR